MAPNQNSIAQSQMAGNPGKIATFVKKMPMYIIQLFQPEEVEVTFKTVGKRTVYTYSRSHR